MANDAERDSSDSDERTADPPASDRGDVERTGERAEREGRDEDRVGERAGRDEGDPAEGRAERGRRDPPRGELERPARPAATTTQRPWGRSPEWPFRGTASARAPPGERIRRGAGREGDRWEALYARPDVDIVERAAEIDVWVDLPGCQEDTIELSGDERTLYVSADRTEAHWEDSGLRQRERARHAERTIHLPSRAEIDEAEASFDKGVLYVRVPKHEAEHHREIAFE